VDHGPLSGGFFVSRKGTRMATPATELRNQAHTVLMRMHEMNDAVGAEGRDFTAEEQTNYDAARDEWMSLKNRAERQEFLENTPARDEDKRIWELDQDARADAPKDQAEADARGQRAYEQSFREYLSVKSPKLLPAETWATLYSGARTLDTTEQKQLKNILSPAQYQAAMSVGAQTGGGFWVPDAMMERIEKAMLWFGGMSQFASTITTDNGADLPWPVYDDTGNVGRRLSENTAATATDLSVGVRVLKSHMYSSDEVLVSYQLLQDWPVEAEGILADALAERIARVQNTEFTTYDGADGPQGLVPVTTLGVTAASATDVTPDELQRLQFSVNRSYRDHPSSRYMANDTTVGEIMRMKDGNGNYIFMSPNSSTEPLVWGKPIVVNNDMPDTATGLRAIVFGKGDAYKIRTVRGFSLLRMDERYAPSLQVSFLGFARADGGYINAGQNPIKHLIMA
jgi:HK97 family phage major capsid protein